MGWDAYAVRPEIDPRTSTEDRLSIEVFTAFRKASDELARLVGCRSDNLADGTLGGLSAGILARATGLPDFDETSKDGQLFWTPETVRRARVNARWDFTIPEDDHKVLVTEARLFLETCASCGLAIWFDW